MCPRIFKEYHTLKEALSDAIFHRYAPEFYRIDFHTLRIPDSYSMFQCKYYINKYKNDPLCVNEYNTYVENYQLYCEITENFRTKCNLGTSFPVNDIVGGVNSVILAYDNLQVYSNKLTDELIQKIIQKCENKLKSKIKTIESIKCNGIRVTSVITLENNTMYDMTLTNIFTKENEVITNPYLKITQIIKTTKITT